MYNKKEVIHMFNLSVSLLLFWCCVHNEYHREEGKGIILSVVLMSLGILNLIAALAQMQ